MRRFIITLLAVLSLASAIETHCFAQSVWQNAVAQAMADATAPPQRPASRVPSMYGGYGVAASNGRTVRQTAPVPVAATAVREPRRLPAATLAYYGPVGEDDATEIVQVRYEDVNDVYTPPQTATHAVPKSAEVLHRNDGATYRPPSVAQMPMPSPALTESWDIEGQLARPMNTASRQQVAAAANAKLAAMPTANTSRAAVAATPPATTTPRTLYASRGAPTVSRYVPMAGGTAAAPSTVSPASTSVWKRLTSDFRPSNDRRWQPNLAVLPTIEFQGNQVTIRNVRYTIYQSKENYTPRYYDATYDLNSLQTLDIIVAPFPSIPSVGHVELSFGFRDGRHIILSVEPRFEDGEKDDPVSSMVNQFELMYLFADERDAVRLYTQVGRGDVFLYRLNMTPEETRKVFESAAVRANALATKPEFYHGITNNCATNLFAHINYARAGAIPRDYRSRFPGLIDKLLFERKMIVTNATSMKEARENAKINWLAEQYGDLDYFSVGIRQNLF